MALELEFWEPDGPNGDSRHAAVRVMAWEIPRAIERSKTSRTVYITLRDTRDNGRAWCVWHHPTYTSPAAPMGLGPL